MNNPFKNKKIIITGHTGFKGSWLLSWLIKLEANILGISKNIPTSPSHYNLINKKKFKNLKLNITNQKKLKRVIKKFKPDFIFHLAAQAIVFKSIKNPIETWNSNLIGTLNLLEAVKNYKRKCAIVIITSDKCYENKELNRGYSEKDRLGGSDPYSASKAAAEILIHSYLKTYFSKNNKLRIATARAGNVIGGGDWSESRIIPDCVRAWSKNKKIVIRNPKSTRPWQHVVEPLYGYLLLANNLYRSNKLNSNSFNFGPSYLMKKKKVEDVVKMFSKFWSSSKWIIKKNKNKIETKLLSLNSNKAYKELKWKTSLSTNESLILTAKWYENYYKNKKKHDFTIKQIEYYEKKIKKKIFF